MGVFFLTTHPCSLLLQADGATLYLNSYKDVILVSTIHRTVVAGPFFPVEALARRAVHVYWHARDNTFMPISYVGGGRHVLAGNISKVITYATAKLGLLLQGHTLDQVISHSLQASGAMALKLNGADGATIMWLGRWKSTTFVAYTHTQIAAFSAGCAQRILRHIFLINIS